MTSLHIDPGGLLLAAQIAGIWLLVDFCTGVLHWFEDRYVRVSWPLLGRLVAVPNIIHHYHPTFFTQGTWWSRSRVLVLIGVIVVSTAWFTEKLDWKVWLFVGLGINANQVHHWSHLPRRRRPGAVRVLHAVRLLQHPKHHAKHHRRDKDDHYCTFTGVLNPLLDNLRFWTALEAVVLWLFGVRPRPDGTVATPVKVPLTENAVYPHLDTATRQALGLDSAGCNK